MVRRWYIGLAAHVVGLAVRVLGMALALALPACASADPCAVSVPDAVLQCYADAMEARDLDALEELLAPDYLQITVARPRADVVDREGRLRAAQLLFTRPGLRTLDIWFGDAYHVVEGDDPDTWRVENVTMGMEIREEPEPMIHVAGHMLPSCVTLYVRRSPLSENAYVIYRDVWFVGDCESR